MSGFVPVSQTQSNSQYGGSSNTATAGQLGQQNQFGGGQLNLQNLIPSLYGSLLQGNIPSSFTAPPQVFQAYNNAFSNYVTPQLAAQYGAGSPQIGAQQSYGNQQLAANLYQQGIQNYGNILGSAGGYGLTPIGVNQQTGATTQGTNFGAEQGQTQSGVNGTILGTLLASVLANNLSNFL